MGHVSVFQADHDRVWAHRYDCTLHVANLTGGFPLNADVIPGWLKSKIVGNDELLQAAIAQNLVDSLETAKATAATVVAEAEAGGRPSPTVEDAIAALSKSKSLKGFKRDETGLRIEGRHAKAMLKEAASIAVQGGHIQEKGWGLASNKKWLKAFFAEHVQVPEPDIYIYVNGDVAQVPDEVRFDFVHAAGNHGFKQSEIIHDAEVSFTVETDFDFPKDFWPSLWVTAEQQGLGADRSQGQGRFVVTKWEKQK